MDKTQNNPIELKLENQTTKNPNANNIKNTKRKIIFKFFLFLLVFFISGFLVFTNQVTISDQSSTSWISRLPIIKQLKHLAESADRKLKGENRDRINILLLGMGGANHDGGYLTDTIILASIQPSTGKVAMISIPRDLAVPIENMGWRKINHINAFAEMEKRGSGGIAISQALSDILDQPIDYYVRVDFQGFINIIDKLGGIEVNVDNTFDDYRYPVMGREQAENYESRYEHLHFDKGPQIMDGKLALKYARSRHAYGIEGSDFARARRQQKIILAAKDKMFSLKTILNPKTIADIISETKEHISTNLKIWEILKLKEMLKDIDKTKITNKVLDNSPNGLLVDTISQEGAYLLMPKSGDFSEIQYYVKNVFVDAPKEIKNKVITEHATIEVRNGTWINGLASKVSLDLEKMGFSVIRIGNSSRQNFQKSVIYDLSYGEKSKSLAILKEKTNANVSFGLPDWLIKDISKDLGNEKNPIQPDFLLILGQNADKSFSGRENMENIISTQNETSIKTK